MYICLGCYQVCKTQEEFKSYKSICLKENSHDHVYSFEKYLLKDRTGYVPPENFITHLERYYPESLTKVVRKRIKKNCILLRRILDSLK